MINYPGPYVLDVEVPYQEHVLPMIPGRLTGTTPATGTALQVGADGQTVYDPLSDVTWLANANLATDGIDRVFLTGGSSLVPAVRAIFHRRFDAAKIETGAELESIASGLALMGRERDLSRWTTRAPKGAPTGAIG